MLRVLAVLLALCGAAHSEERSPRESESKAEAAQPNDQQGATAQQPTAPTAAASAPVINVYTAKHAGEESHCAKPKDWKEWPAFSWCKADAWIDAERVIALFTVILGIATWLLWRATKSLVEGAERTAERQLRAYVSVTKAVLEHFGYNDKPKITVEVRNSGQTPAYKLRCNLVVFAGPFPLTEVVLLEEGNAPSLLGPGESSILSTPLGAPLTSAENAKIIAGGGAIYARGIITYVDAFSTKRTTKYSTAFRGTGQHPGPGAVLPMTHTDDGNEAD